MSLTESFWSPRPPSMTWAGDSLFLRQNNRACLSTPARTQALRALILDWGDGLHEGAARHLSTHTHATLHTEHSHTPPYITSPCAPSLPHAMRGESRGISPMRTTDTQADTSRSHCMIHICAFAATPHHSRIHMRLVCRHTREHVELGLRAFTQVRVGL